MGSIGGPSCIGTQKVHLLDATKATIATLSAILVTTAIIFFVLGEGRVRHPVFYNSKALI